MGKPYVQEGQFKAPETTDIPAGERYYIKSGITGGTPVWSKYPVREKVPKLLLKWIMWHEKSSSSLSIAELSVRTGWGALEIRQVFEEVLQENGLGKEAREDAKAIRRRQKERDRDVARYMKIKERRQEEHEKRKVKQNENRGTEH